MKTTKRAFLIVASAAIVAATVKTCSPENRSDHEFRQTGEFADSDRPDALTAPMADNGTGQAGISTECVRSATPEGVPIRPILPLSDDEAVDLVFSEIGISLQLKEAWSKVDRCGPLLKVSILRYVHLDGSVGDETKEYVDAWVNPNNGTIVDLPGSPPAPMDDETILELTRKADPWLSRMMESHPVQSIRKIPGIALVELAPDPRPAVPPGEVILDGPGPFSVQAMIDTRTGSVIIETTPGP